MVRTLLTATAIVLLSTSVPAQITQLCFPGTGGVINCPCPSQAPANPAGGCANHGAGATTGAVLNASGTPSVSADMSSPTLFLATSNHRIPPTAGILNVFYSYKPGIAPTLGSVSGAGVRCIGNGGDLRRLYVTQVIGGTKTKPEGADLSISARSSTWALHVIAPPETRYYFNVYRDPQAAAPAACNNVSATVNLTNMVSVLWGA
ncbi:MAG: hypothetical protein ACKVXR_15655 [Planctomycetota bacterium]